MTNAPLITKIHDNSRLSKCSLLAGFLSFPKGLEGRNEKASFEAAAYAWLQSVIRNYAQDLAKAKKSPFKGIRAYAINAVRREIIGALRQAGHNGRGVALGGGEVLPGKPFFYESIAAPEGHPLHSPQDNSLLLALHWKLSSGFLGEGRLKKPAPLTPPHPDVLNKILLRFLSGKFPQEYPEESSHLCAALGWRAEKPGPDACKTLIA